MSLPEILGLIGVILSTIILVIIIFVYFGRNKNIDLDGMEDAIIDKVRDLENSLTKNVYESMLKFSQEVNDQLRKQTDMSNDNITEFRINVNKELVSFQEKIKESLGKDFTVLNESVEKKMFEINSKVEDRLSKGFKDTNETFTKIAERVQVIDDAQKKIQSLSEEMVSLQS
ncbi:MAG TPA: hypothetical protein PKU69_04160, partial [Bacillota bacterium]|nr:hypothetical protein [Bacillota bacterium]